MILTIAYLFSADGLKTETTRLFFHEKGKVIVNTLSSPGVLLYDSRETPGVEAV